MGETCHLHTCGTPARRPSHQKWHVHMADWSKPGATARKTSCPCPAVRQEIRLAASPAGLTGVPGATVPSAAASGGGTEPGGAGCHWDPCCAVPSEGTRNQVGRGQELGYCQPGPPAPWGGQARPGSGLGQEDPQSQQSEAPGSATALGSSCDPGPLCPLPVEPELIASSSPAPQDCGGLGTAGTPVNSPLICCLCHLSGCNFKCPDFENRLSR